MKTIEDIKTELDSLKKSELLNDINALIEEQKQIGIRETNKRNAENQSLRAYKTVLETLGFKGKPEEIETFIQTMKTDSEDKLTLKSLQGQLDTLKRERDEALKSAKKDKIMTILSKELNDKVYGCDLLISNLISQDRIDMVNGNVVFKNGDSIHSMEDGIKNLLDERKDLVRNTQIPGVKTSGSKQINPNIQSIINSGDKQLIRANIDEIAKEIGWRNRS